MGKDVLWIDPSDLPDWTERIAGLPGANVLQTLEWGQIKQPLGWQPFAGLWGADPARPQAAALILVRTLALGELSTPVRVMYVPRGPLMDWQDALLRRRVLDDLQSLAHKKGAIFVKIDPEVIVGTGVPGEPGAADEPLAAQLRAELCERGWGFSADQIQYRNTVWIDLTPDEEGLLARMKPKSRYNIRLAERKGVVVRAGGLDDLHLLYRMYAETSVRDGFTIRNEGYYRTVWETFLKAEMAEPLIADVEGQPVAGVVVFRYARRAWYLYGMSRDQHREKMPNALLQWEAMRRARAAGCRTYDLWGAPNEFIPEDPMWGVFRFKQGLGGQVVRTLGAWDFPTNRLLYRLYTQSLPRLLDLMRRRGQVRTRQEAAGG